LNRRTPGLPLPRLAAIFGLATSVVIITAVVFSSQIETSTADLAGSVQEIANHRFAAKVDHERKALIDVPDGEGGIRFSFEEVSPPSSKAG
jgi:hypothetical protein